MANTTFLQLQGMFFFAMQVRSLLRRIHAVNEWWEGLDVAEICRAPSDDSQWWFWHVKSCFKVSKKADKNTQDMSSMRLLWHISNENRLAVFQLRPSLHGRRNVLGHLLWHILPTSKGKTGRTCSRFFDCLRLPQTLVPCIPCIPCM